MQQIKCLESWVLYDLAVYLVAVTLITLYPFWYLQILQTSAVAKTEIKQVTDNIDRIKKERNSFKESLIKVTDTNTNVNISASQ